MNKKKFLFFWVLKLILIFPIIGYSFQYFANITGTPAVDSHGTIYAGIAADDNFYTFNGDGSLKWKLLLPPSLYHNSPVIDENMETLYIGNGTYLYAITFNGKLKWRFNTGYTIYSTPAIGYDSTIYLPVSYRNQGMLYAISKDGFLIWKKNLENAVLSSPALDLNQNIYLGIRVNGLLEAISPDGITKWIYQAYDISDSSPAISDDGTIYIAGNYLYAITPNGILKWKYFLNNISTNSSPVIDIDGTIFVASDKLYSIKSDGNLKWSATYHSSYISNSTPAVSNGNVYLYSGKYLYSYDKQGGLKWKKELGYDSYTNNSIKLTSTGKIILNALDGNLYSINDNFSISNSQWPMFHNDIYNSGREKADIAPTCSSANLYFCKNQSDCEKNSGKWCNTYCSGSSECLDTNDILNKSYSLFFLYFNDDFSNAVSYFKGSSFNLTICFLKRESNITKGLLYIAILTDSGILFVKEGNIFKFWDGATPISKDLSYKIVTENKCQKIFDFTVPESLKGNFTIYAVITKNEEFLNEGNLLSKLIMQEIKFNNE